MQRISTTVQQGNAACIIPARPINEDLESVFNLLCNIVYLFVKLNIVKPKNCF